MTMKTSSTLVGGQREAFLSCVVDGSSVFAVTDILPDATDGHHVVWHIRSSRLLTINFHVFLLLLNGRTFPDLKIWYTVENFHLDWCGIV